MKAKLSMAFEDLRGKDGNVVITKGRTGLVLRALKRGRNPQTTAQRAVRNNMAKATATWKSFTSSVVSNWFNYAQTITKTNPITGQTYHPTSFNAFVGLTCKFLQVTPAGSIPTTPPATGFAGDTITVLAAANVTNTGITFTASGANAAGVKTEFLVQKLKSATGTPQARSFRSKGFFGFISGQLSQTVTLPAGSYAVGYRFVNATTGQETGIVALTGVITLTGIGAVSTNKADKATTKKAA